jgi:ceramide glucosyltransferase
MFPLASSVLLACAAVAAVIQCLGIWSARRHVSRPLPDAPDEAVPPLTLLKPLKGMEDELEGNLRSFFEQRYPAPVQIVFASTEAEDPALALAREVAKQYPATDTEFVVADPGFALNPKVCNLKAALDAARYDTIVQSDANVRMRPGFLRELVGEFVAEQASLQGCLVVGSGERSLGAALENLQLSAFIAPAMCAALIIGRTTCIVGKIVVYRRSEFEQLGGLDIVKDVLLEDFVLGETYRKAGKKLLLSRLAADNVNVNTSLGGFFSRHCRWLILAAVVSKPAFVGQLFSNPLALSLAAWAAAGFDARLLAPPLLVTVCKTAVDASTVRLMRGQGMKFAPSLLSPVRDLLHVPIWFYSAFTRTTEWRGRRFRLGPDSRILPLPD